MIKLLIVRKNITSTPKLVHFEFNNKYYIQLETEDGMLKEDVTDKISAILAVTIETNKQCVSNFSIGSQEFKNIETYFIYNER